ncbi:barstar family protein [Streptomyces sp. DSM 40750]|uniref:barstar family protein n=1 Tax=Streptomyces sp. DSM 40750 TaxID=2801030 RepID=UPI00214BF4DF|nr:barstar family protein [Streptomyces sp. DSM 40750]UUU24327.1 barstar family protein [Streptomyces sp. DSM 40750]
MGDTERPKYVLLSYDAEAEFNGEDGYEETWASCTDTENLFGDPSPPPRGIYELLGCAPEGELETALTRARADGSAPLGFLVLEILGTRGEPVYEWYLEDVRVLGDRPCPRDLSLRDIVIEASQHADNPSDYPQRRPLSRGFRLLGPEGEPRGSCRDLAPLDDDLPDHAEPPVRLLGCATRGALRAALNAGEEDLGHAKLLRVDAQGGTVQAAVEGELTAWIPSARGRGLVDLTLEPWSDRPPTAAERVWELWDRGRPTEPNLWARCGTAGRRFWLDTALANQDWAKPDAAPGTTYHLDGRHITDDQAFYCALGETVNGPGGYFGRCLDAVGDALCGNFGATTPFTLIWHDAHIARECLGLSPRVDIRPETFEELLAFLAERRVDARLA